MTPVVAAVLRDDRGRVLLARRPQGKHLAGTWEFPGGKLESDESPAAGLARELAEELGIEVAGSEPLLTLTHHYQDRCVRLLLREVRAWHGQLVGREGQALAWVSLAEARALPMPPADRPMLTALGLDPRCAISPDPAVFGDQASFLRDWKGRLECGFGWIQLRARSLTDAQLRPLAARCAALARDYGACWTLEAEPTLAEALGADGVHLGHEQLRACRVRPLAADRIVTASCQTTADLTLAGRLGLDLVMLSPGCAGRSPAASRPQPDWAGFERLCADSPLPVLATGGVGPGDLSQARAAGAFGVAGTAQFAAS